MILPWTGGREGEVQFQYENIRDLIRPSSSSVVCSQLLFLALGILHEEMEDAEVVRLAS